MAHSEPMRLRAVKKYTLIFKNTTFSRKYTYRIRDAADARDALRVNMLCENHGKEKYYE